MHDGTSTTEANMAVMNDFTEETYFRKAVFYVLIDDVITGLSVRFNAENSLQKIFIFCGNIPQCVKVRQKRKQKG